MAGKVLLAAGLLVLLGFVTPAVGITPTETLDASMPLTATTHQSSNQSSYELRATPAQRVPAGIKTLYNSSAITKTTGGTGVSVAVLDSGVDQRHPDLEHRVTACRDYTTGTTQKGQCPDGNGHGTHVAGTVLADGGQNNTGIYGVAPNASLLAFKVCDDDGRCRSDWVAPAIRDATDAGADIIVLSLGGVSKGGTDLDAAITHATENDVLIVAAAGNSGPDLDSIEYPAADPRVVSVGATTRGRQAPIAPSSYGVPEFSSRGVNASEFQTRDRYLEVTAPGTQVLSTLPEASYGHRSGTSVAVPHIAGFAAKLWPHITDKNSDGRKADDVRRQLREHAAWLDVTDGMHARPGYDPAAGIGIPARPALSARFTMTPANPIPGETVTLTATDTQASDREIARYEWDVTGDGQPDIEGKTVTHAFASPGQQSVGLRVTDRAGAVATTSKTLRVNAPPEGEFDYEPELPLVGETIRFTGTARDPEGTRVTYAWDFGSTSAGRSAAVHSFDTPGEHPVELELTDADGATTILNQTVLVNDRPKLTVSGPSRVRAGEIVLFESNVENTIGETTVRWEFPDGTTTTGLTASYAFEAGQQPVRITVMDEYGAETTEELVLTVATPTPTATETPTPRRTTVRTTTAPPLAGFTSLTLLTALLGLLALTATNRNE